MARSIRAKILCLDQIRPDEMKESASVAGGMSCLVFERILGMSSVVLLAYGARYPTVDNEE